MKILKQTVFLFLLICALFLIPTGLLAQPVDPCTDPDLPCPIDNNLIILIVAAIGFAGKKAFDFKKAANSL